MKFINIKNHKIIYVSMSVLIMGIIVSMTAFSIHKNNKRITADTEYTIMRDTKQIKEAVESSIGYAFNSIQVTASEISKRMTADEIDNPTRLIRELLPNTPFISIEYVREDGMNITDAGEHFDASDREYYINGMAGKTGIWVNYTPKYSKEPLLNFYTPLVYEDRIVGVLTGTLGGNTSMASLLVCDYLGEPAVGVLLDGTGKVITSSDTLNSVTDFSLESYEIPTEHIITISQLISSDKDTVIRLQSKDGAGIGYMSVIPSVGWKIIEVLPTDSLNAIRLKNNSFAYIMLATVLAAFVLYFLLIFFVYRNIFSKEIRRVDSEREEQFTILKSMSEIYYSMHMINLTDNTVYEYSSRNEVKEIVNSRSDADAQMRAIMTATVEDKYLDRVLTFTDLSSLPERMKNKKNISFEFVAKNYGWFRCEFIAIEADARTGLPCKVMFTTQIIDEEKRREEALKLLSSTDGLTGLLNRRAYIEDVAGMEGQEPSDTLVYLAIDINGLKNVNDRHGHEAGDEVIKGTAECIRSCFENLGRIYRTGGDELVVIFNSDAAELDRIKSDFEQTVSDWSGKTVRHLSVSCGYVSAKEYPGRPISELANIADKRMYQAKTEYYKHKNVEE